MSNLQYQYGCYPIDPAVATSYDYTPSLAASIVFVSLFGLSLAFHSGLAAYTKMWWGLVSLSYHLSELAESVNAN